MITAEPSHAGALVDLLTLAAHSFLAYVETSASPAATDDADRRALALFAELSAKEKHYVEAAYDLAYDAGLRVGPRPFALETSYFNYLRGATLLERLPAEVDREIAALQATESALAGFERADRARRLVHDFLALRRDAKRRALELLQALKPPAPPPPSAAPAPAAAKPAAPPSAPTAAAKPAAPTPTPAPPAGDAAPRP
ncbi:MAG TPA: hypothetical protein VEI02_05530 [Planctomycetota bacterium]|nr:hypothetical protein [Planctomycetota bacterium]